MKKITKTFLVEPYLAGTRLDKFLVVSLDGEYSRQKIQDFIKQGDVAIDKEVQTAPKYPVDSGSSVVIQVPLLVRRLEGEEVDFAVVYQDKDMAVINKPAGLVVHPETESGLPHEGAPTLAHGLVKRFPELEGEDSLRPGIVHRLDKDTSGLLAVGLSERGREYLKKLFAERTIHKEYLAIVQGVPEEPQGEIDFPIGRHPAKKISMAVVHDGKEALTRYRVVYASEDARFSVLAVTIITGRTHQIRVHLSAMGHPIVGDTLYTMKDRLADENLATPLAALKEKKAREIEEANAGRPLPEAGRQMLHAWRLAFPYEAGGGVRGAVGVSGKGNGGQALKESMQQAPKQAPKQVGRQAGKQGDEQGGELGDELGASQATGQVAGQIAGLAAKQEVQVATGEGILSITCPPPSDFMELLEKLLHEPLRVVVTGMPGSGKSAFTHCFEEFGVPVFSADACVRDIYGPDGDGTRLLRMRFGDAYANEQGVDKQALGAAMRESDNLRREIEDMIHPLVYHALDAFWRDKGAHPMTVAEIPLFFESGADARAHADARSHADVGVHASTSIGARASNGMSADAATGSRAVDVTVGVSCPFGTRAGRMRETRGWSEEVITAMEVWQLPEEEKMARCDVVISNAGDLTALRHEASKLHRILQERYREQIEEKLRHIVAGWEELPLEF